MEILRLTAGQEAPWHCHSEVTDTFWGMGGRMVIETHAPTAVVDLAPGQMHAVPLKRAHRVTGKDRGRCRFAILQGVGASNFMPLGACCAGAAWPSSVREARSLPAQA
ncbi:cupin domain-containing protein [Roseomonas rosulenta]|uniref:hypothetical protein n=1 Tax=Roseomonas rosulenta TaxID=2748667 RepID=UPI0018E00E65|nr:hypothetical protein [Roseomonas rosulenta]